MGSAFVCAIAKPSYWCTCG